MLQSLSNDPVEGEGLQVMVNVARNEASRAITTSVIEWKMKKRQFMLDQLYRLGPRNEEWRLHWCFRTCVSVTVFVFLYLLLPTRNWLERYSVPAFTGFVTVLVKDVTLGASMLNAWACILGSLLATVLVQIVVSGLSAQYGTPDQYPHEVVLALLFVAIFILQYMELQLMGKKLGVSLLAWNMLSFHEYPEVPLSVWKLFVSVLIGCLCSLFGNIIPLPARLAGTEVRSRLNYYCTTICALLRDELSAWLHEPFKGHILDEMWEADFVDGLAQCDQLCSTGSRESNPAQLRWRRLRLLIHSTIAFRRSHSYKIGWLHTHSINAKNRYLRIEMITYLHEQLETLRRRNTEAAFEPMSRALAMNTFSRYTRLISTLLAILAHFERQISALECKPQYYAIYSKFFANPNLRKCLWQFVESVCNALQALFGLLDLGRMDGQCGAACRQSRMQKVVDSVAKMICYRRQLDDMYFYMRGVVYYGIHSPNEEHYSTVRREQDKPSTAPLLADLSFTLNTALFLLDSLCDKILEFHKEEELLAFAKAKEGGDDAEPVKPALSAAAVWQSIATLFRDLVPNQSNILCVQCTPTVQCKYTPVIRTRLLSAGMVASAMTIAAVYGIYSDRNEPALASFTIAYLAGGTASGINIMTCINRSIGTVVACVYVIFVVYILNAIKQSSHDPRDPALYVYEALLLGGASVLFQLPCTYIRSYPLYAYSGTVAGFTAALLLINVNLTTTAAVDRIVDTFVGVLIYLVVELLLFAHSSEQILLNDIAAFLNGIDQHFSTFHNHFQALKPRSMSKIDDDTALPLIQLDGLILLVDRQREMLPFYKSEPRLLQAPALPDRLLQEVIHFEHQAMNSMQMMQFVIHKVHQWSDGRAKNQQLNLLELYRDLSTDNRTADCRYENKPSGTIADFEAMLLPLQPQFMKVEQLVSGALAVVSQGLTQLLNSSVRGAMYCPMGEDKGALQLMKCINHQRFLAQQDCCKDMNQVKYQALYFGEMRGEEVESLFHDFQDIISSLQEAITGSSTVSVSERLQRVKSDRPAMAKRGSSLTPEALATIHLENKITSNAEIKLICTLLDSTQNLISALQGLSKGISRLQAYRDITVTQNAT